MPAQVPWWLLFVAFFLHWTFPMTLPPDLVLMPHASPLGTVILAATARGLAGLWFDGQRHQPDLAGWPRDDGHPLLQAAAAQLDAYWSGQAMVFDLPLDLQGGTPFQQQVWRALCDIPPGQTCGYGELARRVGRPSAARAVGAAVGRNPISIVVPCHRVVGSDGRLTGYAGGLARKSHLLALEAAR